MTLRKLLLAGAAGLALTAGPVLAEGTDQAPGKDMQTEGAVELETSAETDSVAQLESLGYTDVEPIEAQGDAAPEGQAHFTATNADGDPVTILFDEEAGTVISEEPTE
ncbi:MAG: PepSY domain-containing protein [Parvibaculum sp.]|uniref:PepSY domain-containing protein n=1 Tax=Parvibaculum sp. TaxID=2024848 RepID=UPI002ABA3148|nr:PepSY domain-containing protein [Parvibaculum sp.]MDZ4381483.1 PepSY domain-containing protein [Parvibaculum sp.]